MARENLNRSRHQSQAVQISTFGKPQETAQSGYGKRLFGAPLYGIPLDLRGDENNVALGDLTAGLWIYGIVVHSVNVGTLKLALAPVVDPALAEIIICSALPLATPAFTASLPAGLQQLGRDRVLTATVTGGDPNAPTTHVTLLVSPVAKDWA